MPQYTIRHSHRTTRLSNGEGERSAQFPDEQVPSDDVDQGQPPRLSKSVIVLWGYCFNLTPLAHGVGGLKPPSSLGRG